MNLKYKKYDNYKPSGVEWLGDVPEHWGVKRVKAISRIKRGASPRPIADPRYFSDNGEYSWVRIADVTANSHYLLETKDTLSKLGANLSVKIYEGELFLSIAGSVGKPMISKIKCCIHDGFVYFPDLKKGQEFLYRIFETGRPYVGLGKHGTQLNLNTETIANIKIPFPPLEEQTAIANFLDHKTAQIDKAIAQKGQLIELLKERRQILIHEAVTQGLDKSVEMKDSGVEWIGEVPKGWEVKKLKHVGKMVNGYAFNSNEFVEQGVRVMKISNIQTMNIDWSEASFINEKYYDKLPQYRIFKNDIVFALTRPIISTGIKAAIVKSNDKILLNQRNAVLKSFNNVVDKWIYFIILNDAFVQEFDNEIDKTGQQPNISVYSIGNLFVPVPSIKEQQEIVNYIETQNEKIKTAISLKEREISSLKEYKTVLIDAAVTGKVIVD
jgi:type I restriction enzyme S subunit